MITRELFQKTGFTDDDTDFILSLYQRYYDKLDSLAGEYMSGVNTTLCFESDACVKRKITPSAYTEKVQKTLPDINPFTARLMGWISCVPYLQKVYKANNLTDELFFDCMKDFTYKIPECKKLHGATGIITDWLSLFFELKLFAFGRLEYEITSFTHDEYRHPDFTLKKGDTVYSCHIPPSGPLTGEQCMDSYRRAYRFFKPGLKGDIMPVVCHTWLLYQPYVDNVFPKDSNLFSFANSFDIIKNTSTQKRFAECWRVFGCKSIEQTQKLPADNSLRRNFIRYIDSGGDFGHGYGVILYNGKTDKIINKNI